MSSATNSHSIVEHSAVGPHEPHSQSWRMPGLDVTDVSIPVPLRHDDPAGASLSVFARIYASTEGKDLPYLVYVQGGPGFEAPRATSPSTPSWLGRALQEFRVVMLDQRGTGRSCPLGPNVRLPEGALAGARTLAEASPDAQAEYFTHFRADSIVRDAELVREHLGVERWGLLGQSFGGFTTARYISAAPGSVALALFTGGLPAVDTPLETVYSTTWASMRERSERMWERFPHDRDRMRTLALRAEQGRVRLPGGQHVGVERLRRLGMMLGATGGQERLHYLLNLDFDSPAFAYQVAAALPFTGRNPIYSVLHESCWADGGRTQWAAERAMPDDVREDPTLLAGEHMHREVFDEDPDLAPLSEAAMIVAQHEWPRLYDAAAWGSAQVPGAAAVYYTDAYVPHEFSMATARMMPGIKPWVTSEWEHGGLAASGESVFAHVLDLALGRRDA